jgi:helix-turn-helix protein
VYSTGPEVSLANVVDVEPTQVEMLLGDLRTKGLIADGQAETELTAKGRIVVSDKLEDVNT